VYIAGTMDLNELPLEFDYDFLDEANIMCARSQCNEQDGQNHQNQNDVDNTLVADGSIQNAKCKGNTGGRNLIREKQ